MEEVIELTDLHKLILQSLIGVRSLKEQDLHELALSNGLNPTHEEVIDALSDLSFYRRVTKLTTPST
ncbi:MAG: hypothetical protein GOV15_04420, partial [Candidatus Diapherotrites archaeon]|nr:hypothetical protein [Candidatus Diapherotrites archaeon]